MMATAPATKPADKVAKPKKEPKPLLTRLDEQLTRAAVQKKISFEEITKFEARVTRLKAFLEE
jgi:hypothetical protein